MRLGRWFRRLLLLVMGLVVLALGALLVLATLAVERMPLVVDTEVLDPDFAGHARQFAAESLETLLEDPPPVTLTATETELTGLLALASHAAPSLSARVNLSELGLLGAATLQLPSNPLGDYLNVAVQVEPSSAGLHVTSVRFGRLRLPRGLAARAPALVLDLVLGNDHGTLLVRSVRSVATSDGELRVLVDLPPDLDQRVASVLARLGEYRDRAQLLGDPARVRVYVRRLIELAAGEAGRDGASLAEFVGPLFALAGERAARAATGVAAENEAALLALVIYLGSERFEPLVGTVRSQSMRAHQPPAGVVLAGREDLRLHFLVSAGLELVSNRGVSIAAGEFKELLEAGAGGSGFSFVELAADRAGVRFARVAVDGAGGARRLQEALAATFSEAGFFPDVSGLPEGLADAEFRERFGSVDDPRYAAMLERIDARIDRLPAYRAGD